MFFLEGEDALDAALHSILLDPEGAYAATDVPVEATVTVTPLVEWDTITLACGDISDAIIDACTSRTTLRSYIAYLLQARQQGAHGKREDIWHYTKRAFARLEQVVERRGE